jgi:hypothetical protein
MTPSHFIDFHNLELSDVRIQLGGRIDTMRLEPCAGTRIGFAALLFRIFHDRSGTMKPFPLLMLAAVAVALTGMTGSADAAKRHKKHKHTTQRVYVPARPYAVYPHDRYWAYGPYGNDYSGRRDPSTWEGPLNAWDRARRDDSMLMRR